MRKIFFIVGLMMGLMIWFSVGCSDPVEKRITGVWLIEDITVSGDTSMYDAEQFRYAIEDQKKLRFELKADSSISIYTGMSEISGFWRYEKTNSQVLVTLEGNIQPTLLGTYQGGKLINSDTNMMGTIISTIFIKDQTVVEQP